MNPIELPECPVCLQPFDGESTTPRVLPCGHSACETCLTQLPKPFPNAVRCPACTQLVKYPHPQGPSALPKNIDLLRLSSLLTATNSYNSPKPTKVITQLTQDFIPNLWSHEFYSKWKDWVVPSDAVSIESGAVIEDGFRLYGRIRSLGERLLGMPMRCLLKEKQKVSLLKVGLFSCGDDSGFSYSYVAKIMWVLFGMRDGQRDELGLILRGSLRGGRICLAYGFWYNEVDKSVYLVCERYTWNSFNKLKHEPGCVDEEIENDVYGFTMIDMEICDAVSGLHKEGLVIGCLGLSCFDIDEFGHVYIDFNEVLIMGGRILRMIAEAVLGTRKSDGKEFEMRPEDEILKTQMFVSPELLLEMLHKVGIDMGPGNLRSAVGYGSDVWSLACVLIWHLVGKPFIDHMNSYLCSLALLATDKNDFDFKGFYMSWLEKVNILLDSRLCSEGSSMKDFLCKCLDLDPERRPSVEDVWKCIRGLIIKPRANVVVSSKKEIAREKNGHCILLGELCQLQKGTGRISEKLTMDDEKEDERGRAGEKVEELMVKRDIIEGISSGHLKCIDLKGHLDCITGLAIGGGFLFSSSFDKTVNVWSVQDFSHVHSFKGHEHRIMAIVFVNEEQPLCITGDSGGGICIWSIKVPFEEEPMKKLYEQKDWRYSGIHALAISGTGYFYTGSGDRSIKAWSMQDYTLSCTMRGHKSVVSALAVCNGVLYSGSWDGTIRLWCLSDHSHLTVLGEEIPGNVTSGSVLSLAADGHTLIAAHENGCIKIWSNDVLVKSTNSHTGAIFAVSMEGKWLFSGGWNKTLVAQELSHDESQVDVIQIGSMTCDAVITALIYWEGKLYVGRADKLIKVYQCGV